MKKLEEIQHIVIAGAGTMGYSMGQIFARFGYQVTIYDISREAIERAKDFVRLNQEIEVVKKDILPEESKELLERIKYSTEKTVFLTADFVVEAILENLEIKHQFWEEISKMVPEDILLCSNTSGLSITEISRKVHKPERFLGMHWINPPHIIPLIEIIRGEQTHGENAKLVYDLALRLEKKPVIVKDAPGFVLNRIQFAIMRECLHIEEEGIADIPSIDQVMKYGLGIRYACLGPFEVADFGGLDIFHHIASYLYKDLGREEEDFGKLKEAYENGNLGIKTKRGFYDYGEGRDQEAIRKRNNLYEKVAEAIK